MNYFDGLTDSLLPHRSWPVVHPPPGTEHKIEKAIFLVVNLCERQCSKKVKRVSGNAEEAFDILHTSYIFES